MNNRSRTVTLRPPRAFLHRPRLDFSFSRQHPACLAIRILRKNSAGCDSGETCLDLMCKHVDLCRATERRSAGADFKMNRDDCECDSSHFGADNARLFRWSFRTQPLGAARYPVRANFVALGVQGAVALFGVRCMAVVALLSGRGRSAAVASTRGSHVLPARFLLQTPW